jgi:hypothetical protein
MEEQIRNVYDAIQWAQKVYLLWGLKPGSQQAPIHIWYRGHSKESYELIPSGFRDVGSGTTYFVT